MQIIRKTLQIIRKTMQIIRKTMQIIRKTNIVIRKTKNKKKLMENVGVTLYMFYPHRAGNTGHGSIYIKIISFN